MEIPVPRDTGTARGRRGTQLHAQPPALSLSKMQPPNISMGEYPAHQLSSATRTLFRLQSRHIPTLPYSRVDHRPPLPDCRLALWLQLAVRCRSAFDLGANSLTLIDFDHQLLPDSIVIPGLWGGLIISLFAVFSDTTSAIIGATVGYLSLWTVFQLFKLLTGKEGMGYGDFKLFALFGAWLGWQYLIQILLLSSVVGALVGISLILFRGRDRAIPIPFGPYLATAGWISLLWGDEINNAYLQWAGLA